MKKLILLVFIFLIGCTSISLEKRLIVKNISLVEQFSINSNIEKCIFDNFSDSYFFKIENEILIYSDKKLKNQIGRTGFNNSNFTNLSDICISPDNNLITVDSFSKEIKKFDRSGSFMQKFTLKGTEEPVLIVMDNLNSIYVFDAQENEILVYNDYNQEPSYRFGKFEISNPTSIEFINNNLIIHSPKRTLVFSKIGYLINDYNEEIFFDYFGNRLKTDGYRISIVDKEFNKFLPEVSINSKLSIFDENLIFIQSNKIVRYKIVYEKD